MKTKTNFRQQKTHFCQFFSKKMKNFSKKFADIKNSSIFAPDFDYAHVKSGDRKAAILVSAYISNSIDCFTLSGSRLKTLLTCANVGVEQFFYLLTFLISDKCTRQY